MSDSPANRRKIQSFIVDSKAQLRLFVFFFILLVLNSATLFVTYMASVRFASPEQAASDSQLVFFEANNLVSSQTMYIGLWGFTLSALLTLMFWLTLSHRIFGPAVPIKRHIQRLIEGDYESKIR